MVGWCFFTFLNRYILEKDEKSHILNLVIPIVSITTAFLTSYLFSKIFAERSERNEPKIQIDRLTRKINALRKISNYLHSANNLWESQFNLRKLDSKWPNLTVFSIRSDYRLKTDKYIGYDNFIQILNEFGGETEVQGYLSLRELKNDEIAAQIDPLYTSDYTVEQISRFRACAQHFAHFLFEKRNYVQLDATSYKFSKISESYSLLRGKTLSEQNNIAELSELFSEFADKELRILEYRIYLNKRPLPKIFYMIAANLTFSLLILFLALTQFVLLSNIPTTFIILIVSCFIGNTFSLTLFLIIAVYSELDINEYRILE